MGRAIKVLLAYCVVFSSLQYSFAQDIFKEEKEGAPFYTTSKPSPNAQAATLPEIEKTALPPIATSPATCRSHGGVKCKEGADVDGSVICTDGFRDSLQNFESTCSEAKLVIETINRDRASRTAKIFVRSVNPVDAKEPYLSYRDIEMKKHILMGPPNLDAYGILEFDLQNLGVDEEKTSIQVGCSNCP